MRLNADLGYTVYMAWLPLSGVSFCTYSPPKEYSIHLRIRFIFEKLTHLCFLRRLELKALFSASHQP